MGRGGGGKWKSVRVLGQGTRGEGGHLLSACVGECCECRGGCYSRLPVNNARGECFMARAGL